MQKLSYEKLDDLKKIKKDYGENMSHLCRELFPTILEKPGLLYHLISTHFAKSKLLYGDIISESKKYDFKNFICFLYDESVETHIEQDVGRTVEELLAEKGYTLYECKTNEDIQKFKKYYARGEALCTFGDPYRIDNHYIFFIVKNNVDEIKREDFPEREDAYSTSVLDLQFDKGENQRVSIKSRYNITVGSPDATYSNNLDNIARGLTKAFERDYGFNIGNEYMANFELSKCVKAKDNKYYRYIYEINNIHYCPNNIIIDNGKVIDKYMDKSKYILMDYFIIDKQEKTIKLYDTSIGDSFVDGFDNITNIEEINEGEYKTIIISQDGGREAIIRIDNLGRIMEYKNNYLKECGDKFLYRNYSLQELSLPQLKSCGDYFLCWNTFLRKLNLPQLQKCGNWFVETGINFSEISLPQLQICGDGFLCGALGLEELFLPQLKSCGDFFLYKAYDLLVLNLPQLQSCGKGFVYKNRILRKVNLPLLESCGDDFLFNINLLQELSLPMLQTYGKGFTGGRFDYDSVKGVIKR